MDSVLHIVACMRQVINNLKLEPRSDDEIKDIIGLGMREAIYTLYPDHQKSEFVEHFTAEYRIHFFSENAPQQLFGGVVTMLENLQKKGFYLAIATGKSRRGLDQVLSDTGVEHFFLQSRCADETRSKPHPLMLEEILQTLKVSPQQALMIGDTEYDMEMARNAGVHPVGVSYGAHERSRLQQYQPLHIFDKIEELPGWLNAQQ